MVQDYVNRLMNQPLIRQLIDEGTASLNENGDLTFGKSNIKNLTIQNLDVDPNEEGGLVVEYLDGKYIFYLKAFGVIEKLPETVEMLYEIVNCCVKGIHVELHYLSDFSTLYVGKDKKIKSTTLFKNPIVGSIQLSLALITGVKVRKLTAEEV